MEKDIINILNEKASTKQDVYRKTQEIFIDLQKVLKQKANRIFKEIKEKDKNIEVSFSSKGKFEAQIKFSGETLLFHMHSNIFTLPNNQTAKQNIPIYFECNAVIFIMEVKKRIKMI